MDRKNLPALPLSSQRHPRKSWRHPRHQNHERGPVTSVSLVHDAKLLDAGATVLPAPKAFPIQLGARDPHLNGKRRRPHAPRPVLALRTGAPGTVGTSTPQIRSLRSEEHTSEL